MRVCVRGAGTFEHRNVQDAGRRRGLYLAKSDLPSVVAGLSTLLRRHYAHSSEMAALNFRVRLPRRCRRGRRKGAQWLHAIVQTQLRQTVTLMGTGKKYWILSAHHLQVAGGLAGLILATDALDGGMSQIYCRLRCDVRKLSSTRTCQRL